MGDRPPRGPPKELSESNAFAAFVSSDQTQPPKEPGGPDVAEPPERRVPAHRDQHLFGRLRSWAEAPTESLLKAAREAGTLDEMRLTEPSHGIVVPKVAPEHQTLAPESSYAGVGVVLREVLTWPPPPEDVRIHLIPMCGGGRKVTDFVN